MMIFQCTGNYMVISVKYFDEMFPWKDIYSLNIQEIDEQHKIWLSIVNNLYLQATGGRVYKNVDYLKRAIDEALSYTKFHFNSEEQIMDKMNYPLIKQHKLLHAKFIKKLITLKKRYKQISYSMPDSLIHDTFKTYVEWVIDHIKNEDKNISYYQINNL